MRQHLGSTVVLVGLVVGLVVLAAQASPGAALRPTDGWTLHIDLLGHFPGNRSMVAHHYCKGVTGGLTECQLYDSDAANARLVGVEVVVGTDLWKTFGKSEQAFWHPNAPEIPKLKPTLPDLSPGEAAKVLKSLEGTYGKLFLLWDPGRRSLPMGRPMIAFPK